MGVGRDPPRTALAQHALRGAPWHRDLLSGVWEWLPGAPQGSCLMDKVAAGPGLLGSQQERRTASQHTDRTLWEQNRTPGH